MGSMQKPDGSLRREETSAGSLQKPHLKLRLIPMRIHKRSVSLSRQAGRPFVALSRFCRWFQGVHKRSVLLWVRPQVVSFRRWFQYVHKRSVSLSRQAGRPFVALSRFCRWFQGVHKRSVLLWVRPQVVSSTKGLSLCRAHFVALSRFCRWFQGVHKRSARLCDRFRRFNPQKVYPFVAAGGQAFCRDPSFSSLDSVPTQEVCPFV